MHVNVSRMSRRLACHSLAMLLVCGAMVSRAWADSPAKPVYSVAVVPQFQAVEISRVWVPILERVGQEAGVTLTLKVAKDIPAFEDEVMTGKPDFAYMNPYHQLMAFKAQGYVPLVRDSKLLTGLLVVRQDDPIKSVKELEGKTLAFPAPNAFGASLMIRAQLAELDKVNITPMYAKTHTNAYRQTIVGKTAASGGLRATLDKEPPEVRAMLRVLMETPGAAPHPLSAHPRVPVKVQQALKAAMLRLAGEPDMSSVFKDVPMSNPVAADHARDYQVLEKYRLERYLQ
ncbi:MAG: phosphate/phosphite/phosphonate ABC transporter substrate-binding protein [Aquabacterium sp.]|uniref:phosphate/phosphite/phosphonate ABC transporter substrate-binding protein n=1 Tax=Aquabacterium sp. TaxID=1872578 RepID=UPI0025C46D9A|nr:phosphate/phosphite/phosphonate ABC transporter substrate-binding protein [Aquabacterium sp.]MBI5925488.1 phosphate/phosphite/phosphonate ABC transporter substrate-binding protein [Aquabacterium sp.]